MKHVYRALIFLIVFLGSFTIFCLNKEETKVTGVTQTSVDLADPTFPTMTVKTQGYNINVLHGYNSNLKANLIRESMTPVGDNQEFQLVISELRELTFVYLLFVY